jgi:hypothetical protein
MKKESVYQGQLIKKLRNIFPTAVIVKLDPNYKQGIPDLLILENDRWATLEVKRSKNEKHQPNQDDYVEQMNNMSFSRFIFPENEEEVLHDLEQALHEG